MKKFSKKMPGILLVMLIIATVILSACTGSDTGQNQTSSVPTSSSVKATASTQAQVQQPPTSAQTTSKSTQTQAQQPIVIAQSTNKPIQTQVQKAPAGAQPATKLPPAPGQQPPPPPPGGQQAGGQSLENQNNYSLEQAMSDQAQLSTIGFSGLAFMTGNPGGDTFFPPGKVADFFGFQYMRDVDKAGYGHNDTFIGMIADNILKILNESQKAKLVALAKEQAQLYVNFAYNRYVLTDSFRRNMEGKIPTGSTGLSIPAVVEYTADLYKTDADLCYNRAVVVGQIINSLTPDQKAILAKMSFDDSSTWPTASEDQTFKSSMPMSQYIAVVTYASELFSWYKGGVDADVYYCPERHGTYFGGFFMKDYLAIGDHSFFISTSLTGDSGADMLKILNDEQRAQLTGIIEKQRPALNEIAKVRTEISTELRKSITGETIDKDKVYTLEKRYGELDGQMSALYATTFAAVYKTLTADQKTALIKLRNLDTVPSGSFIYSSPVETPPIPSDDYMFGIGKVPADAGQTMAPATFVDNTTGSGGALGDAAGGGNEALLNQHTAPDPAPICSGKMALTSSVVKAGETIPDKYSRAGAKAGMTTVSPPLAWTGAPANTKSFAIIGWNSVIFWSVYNIPGGTTSLPEDIQGVGTVSQKFITPSEGGPGTFDKHITLYALSANVNVDSSADVETLRKALNAVTLDSATLNYKMTVK